MRTLIALILFALTTPMAMADTALIIANSRYQHAQDLRGADQFLRLERPLRDAGFDVIVVRDGDITSMRAGVGALLDADEDERVVILAAGHFARSNSMTWMLDTGSNAPTLATVSGDGVPLAVLLEIARRAPGRAIVALGMEARQIALGDGLARGVGPLDVPQGVTVVSGAPADLANLTRDVILRPGADLAQALGQATNLRSHGFVSSALPFLDAAAPVLPSLGTGPTADEVALWQAAVELNTIGAYRAYLQQYPNGAFVPEAQARIDDLTLDPLAEAEAAEDALGLTREDRRRIQRALSLLGFDTRGIDGIFGPGTRTAIRNWQASNGTGGTGYLTARQVTELRDQAAQRAAELEEQARIEREVQERADRAFWQATGQGSSEAGLRRYLERFPDGLFADLARARLDDIEADRRAQAEAQERSDWDQVRDRDTIEAYERYLNAYPDGLFRDAAGSRIEELRNPGLSPDELANAEAREAALNMAPITRMLVEQRLGALGLSPGRVDGTFDVDTRRAIRRYQDTRGIPATGYLNQQTVVRLLAEAVGGRIIQ